MRNCIRCQSEMVEDLELRTNDALGIHVGEKGIFKGTVGRVVCAVCPKCGYVETYVSDTQKIQKLSNKDIQ